MLQEETRVIKTSDRCDRCGAEAFVWACGITGELFFCGHHYSMHEESIKNFAYEIIDERRFIK